MRAKSEYPTVHGAQHLPDGSDPVNFEQFGFVHAIFTAADIEGSVTKILVPGQEFKVVFPVWVMLAATSGLSYSTTGTNPQISFEAATWNWTFFDVPTFGTSRFGNFAGYIADGGSDNPPIWTSSIQGEPFQVTAAANDLILGGIGAQFVEVWAFWNRVTVTQP